MLVLSRKPDESIVVNGNIEIIIREVIGNKVVIGIAAPPNIPIFRKELCSATQEKRTPKRASKASSNTQTNKNLWSVFGGSKSITTPLR